METKKEKKEMYASNWLKILKELKEKAKSEAVKQLSYTYGLDVQNLLERTNKK